MDTYSQQKAWKEIQDSLPEDYHFTDDYQPKEEWWDWHENKIHLDTFRNPDAKVKVVMLHGVGTNGRQMSMILGGPLAKEGIETIAIDMPTYGLTIVNQELPVVYDDWIQLGSDYIDYELTKDDRPIFVYGLSAGGMETYDVAAKNKKVKGIIGMTFLDQRRKDVVYATTRNWFMGHVTAPLVKPSVKLGMGKGKIRMSIPSKMSALCNDPKVMGVFMKDETSAANKVTFAFLDSYMNHKLVVEPENFDVCPVLLTQPEKDRWTPLELSTPVLDQIKKVPVKIEILTDGGHYPVEETALRQLKTYALNFIRQYSDE